jgi:hypothetical protein
MPADGLILAAFLSVLAGGCLLLLLLLRQWRSSPADAPQRKPIPRSSQSAGGVSLRPHLLVLVAAPLLAGVVLLMLGATHLDDVALADPLHMAVVLAAVAVLGVGLFYALRRGG